MDFICWDIHNWLYSMDSEHTVLDTIKESADIFTLNNYDVYLVQRPINSTVSGWKFPILLQHFKEGSKFKKTGILLGTIPIPFQFP